MPARRIREDLDSFVAGETSGKSRAFVLARPDEGEHSARKWRNVVNLDRVTQSVAKAIAAVALFSGSANSQGTTRVSVDSVGTEGNSYSFHYYAIAASSADGLIVAFTSAASNLVANDTNGCTDVFVHDRSSGLTERVSVDSSGKEGDQDSYDASISRDGRFVAFFSSASNLVAGDSNGCQDVFVHDRITGVTERVSVDSKGIEGNGNSDGGAISDDGQIVAFTSFASNLVSGDTAGHQDVFVHDRSTGLTERVNVSSSGAQANGPSGVAVISADGQIVAFGCNASNLVAHDTNNDGDVFVHDRSTGVTERVSVDSSGVEGNTLSGAPSIAANGQIVAFMSYADNLVAGDTNSVADAFVHDRSTGLTERVSVDSSLAEGNGASRLPSISADGQLVAFDSFASNLVAGDTNGSADVFVRDRTTGVTTVVSTGCGFVGDSGSGYPSISADGSLVVFESDADDLVAGDSNGTFDIFVHDRKIPDDPDASWSTYGAGYPGTLGEPTLTARDNPVLGTQFTIDVGNSLGKWTVGFLLVGLSRDSLATSLGGTLLVGNVLLFLPLLLDPSGAALDSDLPRDPALCGLVLYVQGLELDPGASKGVSFTPGLELVFGH